MLRESDTFSVLFKPSKSTGNQSSSPKRKSTTSSILRNKNLPSQPMSLTIVIGRRNFVMRPTSTANMRTISNLLFSTWNSMASPNCLMNFWLEFSWSAQMTLAIAWFNYSRQSSALKCATKTHVRHIKYSIQPSRLGRVVTQRIRSSIQMTLRPFSNLMTYLAPRLCRLRTLPKPWKLLES